MDRYNNLIRTLAFLIVLVTYAPTYAQNYNRFLFQDDISLEYADYLLTSRQVNIDHPLRQPFTYKQVFSEDIEHEFFKMFKSYWSKYYGEPSEFTMGLRVGNTFSNQSDPSSHRLESILGYQHGGFIALNKIRIFEAYKNDPLFAGDLSESGSWIYGRVNDAFVDYQTDHNHIFVGKMAQNWGPVSTPSLILSDYPYTYNKILYDYTTRRLKLSVFFSQLESNSGYVYHSNVDTLEYFSEANKYLTGHRLDININDKLKLAFTEMAIYGGPGRQIQFEYLNPMEFYYGLQRNDSAPMSGVWAADLFYRPASKTLIYGQFLLDDIILNNDPGVDDRARFPDRLGVYASIRQADVPYEGLLVDLSYTRIWNRSYQTYSFWENYHYRDKSLGYPTVSSEEVKLRTRFWGKFPHYLSSDLTIGRYGAADATDMFYLQKEQFPIEPVTTAIDHKLRYGWFRYPQLRIILEHRFRHETLSGQTTTDNLVSLRFDYTFLK
jgi:hypothetical protein